MRPRDLLLTLVANQESHQDLYVMRKITGSVSFGQLNFLTRAVFSFRFPGRDSSTDVREVKPQQSSLRPEKTSLSQPTRLPLAGLV